jgi:hypothetical protein
MIVLGFWVSFALTVVALALALVTGRRGRRRAHLVVGPLALVLLAIAILFAEKLASVRSFPPGALAVHLVFAKTGALLALPVIVTGLLLLRNPRWRRAHWCCVLLFLAGVLTATGTGAWVFARSTPQ